MLTVTVQPWLIRPHWWPALFCSAPFFRALCVWQDISPPPSLRCLFLMNLWSNLRPCIGPSLISLLIQMIWDFLQPVFSAPAWIYLITVGADRTFFIGFLSFALGFQSPNYPDKMCLFEGVKVLLVLLKLGPLSICQFRLITTVHLQLAVFVQFNWPRANSSGFLFFTGETNTTN